MTGVQELTPIMGASAACRALGLWRGAPARQAALVRRAAFVGPRAQRAARARPPLALDAQERQVLLDTLNGERFVDTAPAAVHATLLDEGRYLGSVRTMYRLLAANGGSRERRNQLTHPAYTKPELLAIAPNQVWSWDISAPWRRGLQLQRERRDKRSANRSWLILDRQLQCCLAPVEAGRKGAAKLGRLPTAGCHAQSSLNCTERSRVAAASRATARSMVRQRSVRWKPLYTATPRPRDGYRGAIRLGLMFPSGGCARAHSTMDFLPQPSSGATRGRARHLRTSPFKVL
jgi:hypothetical protein